MSLGQRAQGSVRAKQKEGTIFDEDRGSLPDIDSC